MFFLYPLSNDCVLNNNVVKVQDKKKKFPQYYIIAYNNEKTALWIVLLNNCDFGESH